jgi:phosphohistidine phosphatase
VTARRAILQQAAAIPVRQIGSTFEVCLIRKRESTRWGIPKGIIESGHSPEETALIETREEAGLDGRLLGEPVGSYTYRKWGSKLTVAVYLMDVLEEYDEWDEAHVRVRQWTSFRDAVALLDGHPARSLLVRAFRRLAEI